MYMSYSFRFTSILCCIS